MTTTLLPGDSLDSAIHELIAAGEIDRATEKTLRTYGPELVSWLCSILRSEAEGHDAFSRMSEEVWHSFRRFERRCSVRTWCYVLARHAAFHVRSAARNHREIPLSQMPSASPSATHTGGTPDVDHDAHSIYAAICESLDDGDRELLALRVDRNLAWRDIAIALSSDGADPTTLSRKATTLRKRFERIKDRLRELAAQQLLD